MGLVLGMVQDQDLVCLQETHGSDEDVNCMRKELRTTHGVWSSLLDSPKGGVVMIMKNSFMQRFSMVAKVELEKGRCMALVCTRGCEDCLCEQSHWATDHTG